MDHGRRAGNSLSQAARPLTLRLVRQELIAARLLADGFVVLDGLLTTEQAQALKSEVVACHNAGKLEGAGLVNGKVADMEASKYDNAATRGDLVGWFDSDDWPYGKQLEAYLLKLGTLVAELGGKDNNLVPELGTITSRSKAMVACYPGGGARYVKHIDNDGRHPLCRTRLLTALMYINDEWVAGDGGELAIFDADDHNTQRAVVEPLMNRLLLFWSDRRTPHEVRPASKPRYAVTLWLLDNTCRGTVEGQQVKPQVVSLASGSPAEVADKRTADRFPDDDCAAQPAVSYAWHRMPESGAPCPHGNSWQLQVDLRDATEACPCVDVSVSEVLLSSSSGACLLRVGLPESPLPLLPRPPRWSRKRRTVTIEFDCASGA